MFRAGLHARVSTDGQPTVPLQQRPLRDYAGRRAGTAAMQVKKTGSGASARELRQKIVEAARRRDIDVVLVWRLDRWGRSVTDLARDLAGMDHLGIALVWLTEALDLATPTLRATVVLPLCSPRSNTKSCGNGCAPVDLSPGKRNTNGPLCNRRREIA